MYIHIYYFLNLLYNISTIHIIKKKKKLNLLCMYLENASVSNKY